MCYYLSRSLCYLKGNKEPDKVNRIFQLYFITRSNNLDYVAALNGNYTNTGHNANFIVVDMDGRPTQQQNPYPATYAPPPPSSSAQTTYRPPETNPVEPPPPSYQDYTKDHRVPNV